MAKNLLSPLVVRSAKPDAKDKGLYDGEGLYLLVKPNSARWWRLDYTIDGKRKTLSLGVFLEVGLADARSTADQAREKVAQGLWKVLQAVWQRRYRQVPIKQALSNKANSKSHWLMANKS